MDWILGYILLCVGFDIYTYKIPNALIAAGLAGSLLYQCLEEGPPGMLVSLAKAMLMLFILFSIFRIGAIGGGDVKLLGILAANLNFEESLQILIASLFLGAIHGCIILIFKGIKLFKKKEEKPRISKVLKGTRLHFSIAIAIAYFLKMEGWY